MTKIMVLANETIAGEKLLDAILERKGEDVSFHVVAADAAAARQRRLRRGGARQRPGARTCAQWMRDNGIERAARSATPTR